MKMLMELKVTILNKTKAMIAYQQELVMRSNLFNLAFATLMSFSLLGCGLKFGEKKKENQIAEVQGTSCLKDSTASLKLFFAGDAEDEKLAEAFDCLQKSIVTFKENIRGQDKNSYTPGEVASFVTKNFVKDSALNLTPELMKSIMKAKVLLVGGTEELIQKSEVDAISSLIARLKPEVIRMNPHMKVITQKYSVESGELTEEKFNAAYRSMKIALKRLGGIVSSSEREYQLNDLMDLALEVLKMRNAPQDKIDFLLKAKLLIAKFKTSVLGGKPSLQGDEWIKFAAAGAELYMQTIRIKYFLKPLDEAKKAEKFKIYEQIAHDILSGLPELVDGRTDKAIRTADLVDLIDTALAAFPNLPLTGPLIQQVSKLKLVLLGTHSLGSEAWTVSDFKKLRDKLPKLFSMVQKVMDSLAHLKVKEEAFRKGEIKYEDFARAETVLLGVVENLTADIMHGYDLRDLKQLVISLKPLLKDQVNLPDDLEPLFSLVYAGKVALTGEQGPQLTIANLQLILKVGTRGFANYIEFMNFVKPFNLEEQEFTQNFVTWIAKSQNTLALELKLKPSHVLTTEELTNAILAAQSANMLNTKLRQESLTLAFNALWSNILNKPEDRLSGRPSLLGFNDSALVNLITEIVYWVENQKTLLGMYQTRPEFNKDELAQILQARIDGAKSSVSKASALELRRVVVANGYMNYNAKGYLKVLTDDVNRYVMRDLITANISKTLARVLIRAYSGDIERVNNLTGVTLAEIQSGFDNLKQVAYDLELLDPSNPSFISGRFMEASLFLSVSNGDEYANFEEMNHLVMHIFSGIKRGADLEIIAIKKCMKNENLLFSKKSEFDEDCLLNLYLEEDAAFADLPEFLKIKTDRKEDGQPRYTPEMNKAYYFSLLKAAGHVPKENKSVFLGDAALFPHVVQYIEMIYWRHDDNKNGLLEKDEALKAYPVFANLLTELTKSKRFFIKIPDLPGLFIYLLKNGNIPTVAAEMKPFLDFIKDYKCNKPDVPCQKGWEIQSSRHSLGKIFNFIAEASKPKPPTPDGEGAPTAPSVPPEQPTPVPVQPVATPQAQGA
jgi:hypothetical protein